MSTLELNIPTHVAVIMDGNGRWAQSMGQLRLAGHKAGAKVAKAIVAHAARRGVKVLSLFAFSSENWSRPKKEVGFLMDLFIKSLNGELNSLHDNQVKLRFTGDQTGLSDKIIQAMNDAVALTSQNKGLILNVVFNYGGKWDIIQATKKLAKQCMEDALTPEDITEEVYEQALSMSALPHPDLLIRTSGESRLSNFFLWQLAYAELFFCDCFWPEFSASRFDEALDWYDSRNRRFGLVQSQLKGQIKHA